jgi:hypothetical protein
LFGHGDWPGISHATSGISTPPPGHGVHADGARTHRDAQFALMAARRTLTIVTPFDSTTRWRRLIERAVVISMKRSFRTCAFTADRMPLVRRAARACIERLALAGTTREPLPT